MYFSEVTLHYLLYFNWLRNTASSPTVLNWERILKYPVFCSLRSACTLLSTLHTSTLWILKTSSWGCLSNFTYTHTEERRIKDWGSSLTSGGAMKPAVWSRACALTVTMWHHLGREASRLWGSWKGSEWGAQKPFGTAWPLMFHISRHKFGPVTSSSEWK